MNFTVTTAEEEFPADDIEHAIAIASDHIDGPAGPVQILDSDGNIVSGSETLTAQVEAYRARKR